MYLFVLIIILKFVGKNKLLVYADDVNMLGKSLQTVRGNTKIFIKANQDIALEVNSGKTKYMITSRHQNVVQNQNIIIGNLSFENLEKFKYLGVTVTYTNDISEEIKRQINMGNAWYYSLEKMHIKIFGDKGDEITGE